MNIICKLTDKDFGIEPKEMINYRLRVASRGIVIREDGKIAIQNKSNKNEYKLVGGGIEENEDPSVAFKREVLEEAGCEIEIINQLGITEEYRSLRNLKQISNIFIAKVVKDLHTLNLTEKEKSEGAKLLWVEPREALVVLRDRKILEYYLNSN